MADTNQFGTVFGHVGVREIQVPFVHEGGVRKVRAVRNPYNPSQEAMELAEVSIIKPILLFTTNAVA